MNTKDRWAAVAQKVDQLITRSLGKDALNRCLGLMQGLCPSEHIKNSN